MVVLGNHHKGMPAIHGGQKLDAIDLFQPDFFLPAQAAEKHNGAEGERRLIVAILEQAWHDATLPEMYSVNRSLARQWVMAGDAGYITFDEVCEYLRIDADVIRSRILNDARPDFGRRGRPIAEATPQKRAAEAAPS